MGLIRGSGRSPGGEQGNRLQYSCQENPKDRGVWWATVLGVTWCGHDWSDLACIHTYGSRFCGLAWVFHFHSLQELYFWEFVCNEKKNINEPLFAAQKQHDLWGKCSWAHLTILLPFWEIWSKLHILAKPYFSQLKRVYDITGHSRWLFSFSAGPAPASPTPDSQDFLHIWPRP